MMYKCDRCFDRLQRRQIPACIEVCPEKAQIIGPRDEIVAEAHKRAGKSTATFTGRRKTAAPTPFTYRRSRSRNLTRPSEKGPGKPHLKRVANSMADEDNLTKALFIAPVAAVAAGVGKFWNFLSKDAKEDS